MNVLVMEPSYHELGELLTSSMEKEPVTLADSTRGEKACVETAKDAITKMTGLCNKNEKLVLDVVLGYLEDYNSQLSEFMDRMPFGSTRHMRLRSASIRKAAEKFQTALNRWQNIKLKGEI